MNPVPDRPHRFTLVSSFAHFHRLLWAIRPSTTLGGLTFLVLIWTSLLAWKWPFNSKTVIRALRDETHRSVTIGSFHGSFFSPGYVAENVTFGKASSTGGNAFTVRRLVIAARWSDLLLMRKRIRQALIVGLRMRIPVQPAAAREEAADHAGPPRFSEIGELRFEDAAFAFATAEADPEPLVITLQSISIPEVNWTASSPFRSKLSINEPQARIRTEGRVGPWNWSDIGKTPLSGSFIV